MYIAIGIGALLIIGGIISIATQWLWSNQGFAKRNVTDLKAYTRYMGFVDIGLGVGFCFYGVVSFLVELQFNLMFIILIIGIIFFVYGERKYRVLPPKQ